jgi:hypothetical protein
MNDIGLAQVEARHGSRQGHCELDQSMQRITQARVVSCICDVWS